MISLVYDGFNSTFIGGMVGAVRQTFAHGDFRNGNVIVGVFELCD